MPDTSEQIRLQAPHASGISTSGTVIVAARDDPKYAIRDSASAESYDGLYVFQAGCPAYERRPSLVIVCKQLILAVAKFSSSSSVHHHPAI